MKEVLYQDFQMVLGKMRPMKIIVKEARHGNSYSVMEYGDVREPDRQSASALTGRAESARVNPSNVRFNWHLAE